MKLLCMNGHLSDSNDQMKSDFGFDYYRLDNNKSSRTLFMKVSINGCKKGGTSKSNNQKIKILIKIIVKQLGFSSPVHFTTYCKRLLGILSCQLGRGETRLYQHF